MMDTKNLLIILTPTALLSLFPEHLTLTRKCPSSPRFLVGQLECVGVSDLEYKGAGGRVGCSCRGPSLPIFIQTLSYRLSSDGGAQPCIG